MKTSARRVASTSRRKASVAPLRKSGWVSLVGAGPGDPKLLTLRAVERLRRADLVLHDGLVPDDVLLMASRRAVRVSVARRAGKKELTQQQVIDQMVTAAQAGRRVVRLKAGDPFVLGRGGEEARALAQAGIPFDVVPGVTSALAAPAGAGIPVTCRGVASAFLVVSGHDRESYAPVLSQVRPGVTVIVLMGLGERAGIAECLMAAGWAGRTPAAIVINASRQSQRTWTGSLAQLGEPNGITSRTDPGVLVIGDVVSEAQAIARDAVLTFDREEFTWQPLMTRRR